MPLIYGLYLPYPYVRKWPIITVLLNSAIVHDTNLLSITINWIDRMYVSIFQQSDKIDINSGKLQFESKELSDVMQYPMSIGLFCGIRKSLYVVNKDLIFCVCHLEILHWRILFTKYKPVNSIPIISFISARIWKLCHPSWTGSETSSVLCVRALYFPCVLICVRIDCWIWRVCNNIIIFIARELNTYNSNNGNY